MNLLSLVRRREIWWPTLSGWTLLAILAIVTVLLVGRALYPLLAPTAPVGGGLLVVEGWIGRSALSSALEIYRDGAYDKLVTAGGPIEENFFPIPFETYAEMAGHYLRQAGLPRSDLAIVAAPASAQNRTFLSAVMVRDWLAGSGLRVDAIDVISLGPHARRTWRLYRMAFPDRIEIGIMSVQPKNYEPEAWWRTSNGARGVLGEAIAWVWMSCCFHPGPPGSQKEMWGQ